jgi:hypothetical protein
VGGTEPGEPPILNRQSGQSGTASNLHLAIHFTVQTTIRFAIKAAVEFVARGASICGVDAGDWGRKVEAAILTVILTLGFLSEKASKNPFILHCVRQMRSNFGFI